MPGPGPACVCLNQKMRRCLLLVSFIHAICIESSQSLVVNNIVQCNRVDTSYEASVRSFNRFTNLSAWRPAVIQNALDRFQRRNQEDMDKVFRTIFTAMMNQTMKHDYNSNSDLATSIGDLFMSILKPIILIPVAVAVSVPVFAVSLPFILLKNLSPAVILSSVFDIVMKPLVSAAFVLRHPISAATLLRAAAQRAWNAATRRPAPPSPAPSACASPTTDDIRAGG